MPTGLGGTSGVCRVRTGLGGFQVGARRRSRTVGGPGDASRTTVNAVILATALTAAPFPIKNPEGFPATESIPARGIRK